MDMRKGFEGLTYAVYKHFNEDVTSGNFFIFINKQRDRMKIIYWDKDGLAIWYKRLEKGTFATKNFGEKMLSRREFFMLLEGITPKRLHIRYNIS